MNRGILFTLASAALFLAPITSIAPRTVVDTSAQERQECPKVNIECPRDLVPEGYPATISVSVVGAPDPEKIIYKWSVSGSEIIEGQGTKAIKVKVRYNQMVTATVKVCGLEDKCKSTDSCSFIVQD
jgi:hypothetical protein